MGVIRKTLQALAGLILAALAAAVMSTWGLPEENDLLFAFGSVRISVSGIGAGLSLLTVLAFADGWILARKSKEKTGNGRLWNGIGFGLLPGIAVWKCFEQAASQNIGTEVPKGIPQIAWIMEDGKFLPARIELLLAVVLFAAMAVWLIARRESLPDNGDLTGVSLALWCTGRLITDEFHGSQPGLFGAGSIMGWLAAGIMLIILIHWSGRTIRQRKHTGYIPVCTVLFLLSVALIVLIRNRILPLDNPPAELVLICIGALLALKAVICMGRVSR